MAVTTRIRQGLNRLLGVLNLEINTLTAEHVERRRVSDLEAAGLLDRPVYALISGMETFDASRIVEAYERYKGQIERLASGANDVGYCHGNTYFDTPDMQLLYLMVRLLEPKRIVEIGCGNSTRISRQAILDGNLSTKITAIDPYPRNDIAPFVDRFEKGRVEHVADRSLFDSLEPGDILFVDSSHEVKAGNDVARIFCDIIPRLKPGVVVHVHDIFLPYEYPKQFVRDYPLWGEQYVLHALLQKSGAEILWPGHFLQRDRQDLFGELPFLANGSAQSFWFRLR